MGQMAVRQIREYIARTLKPNRTGTPTDEFAAKIEETSVDGRFYQLLREHDGRLLMKWGHYLPVYERYLEQFVGKPVRLLEIGVFQGGSLQLWRKYLGPEAIIFGIDVDARCAGLADLGNQIRIGSQSDPQFLREVVTEMGGVDVVIDDGSHIARHQRISFETLFPLLSDAGIYIAEDLHTSYWPAWEGGLRKPGTFIELMKVLVDDIHVWYRKDREQKFSGAHKQVTAVHFYDSMVVIEKNSKTKPFHVAVGKPSF